MQNQLTVEQRRERDSMVLRNHSRYKETRARSLALYEKMRPYIEKRQPGPMAVYVR